MKVSSLFSALAAVNAFAGYAAADPIPHDARLSVREVYKRALMDTLFGATGSARRYWAWSRVAYDKEFSDIRTEEGTALSSVAGAEGRDWSLLANDDITVWGYSGECVPGAFSSVHTGMVNVIGLDNTNNLIVSAYIGSNDGATWGQDAKALSESSPTGEGQVEKGFAQCALSVKDDGFKKIIQLAKADTQRQIVFTGHSLGGATAHISAATFLKENDALKDRVHVFTYGAPRAGDEDFQESLAAGMGERMANFRHQADPVPMEPLLPRGYCNPGRTWTIKSGDSWDDEGAWELEEKPTCVGRGFGGGALDMATAIFHFGKEHTAYFSGDRAVRRAVEAAIHVGALSKRDGKALSADELSEIEEEIAGLSDDDIDDDSDDNEDAAEDDDEKLGLILEELGIDDKEEAAKVITEQPNIEEQKNFLYALEMAAVEWGNTGTVDTVMNTIDNIF